MPHGAIGHVLGGALACALLAGPGAAQVPVALELVLAVDTSASVNGTEFALQMQGIAAAFRAPEVIAAIESQDGVAVALIQWAGWVGETGATGWHLLRTRAQILAFAARVQALARADAGAVTAIGTAIDAATEMLEGNAYAGRHRRIDVSGDGQNNAGLPLDGARRRAGALGITINGLAILTDFPNLDGYFRARVVAGAGAFVVTADDYRDVARAMRIKLLRELTPPGVAAGGPAHAAARAGSSVSTSASQ